MERWRVLVHGSNSGVEESRASVTYCRVNNRPNHVLLNYVQSPSCLPLHTGLPRSWASVLFSWWSVTGFLFCLPPMLFSDRHRASWDNSNFRGNASPCCAATFPFSAATFPSFSTNLKVKRPFLAFQQIWHRREIFPKLFPWLQFMT